MTYPQLILSRLWPDFPAGDSEARRAEMRQALFMEVIECEVPELRLANNNWRQAWLQDPDKPPVIRPATKLQPAQLVSQDQIDAVWDACHQTLP